MSEQRKRKRFKRNALANSEDYSRQKKVRREVLRENHDANIMYFSKVVETVAVRDLTDLEIFEENVKKRIQEFKSRHHG